MLSASVCCLHCAGERSGVNPFSGQMRLNRACGAQLDEGPLCANRVHRLW